MKRILIVIIIMMCSVVSSTAQDYTTGIGVRGGFSNGLTIKHFISERAAIEGIISSRWKGFNLTGLYEIHQQAFDVEHLNWYYGAGGHIGFWKGRDVSWGDNRDDDYTVIGIDGILGIEYNFQEIPINISLDWKPTMNIIGYSGFWGDGGAFSVRYIF
jgi:hypothetical protein